MYKIKEFAEKLNVTTQTLRNWDKKGILIPIKLASGHRRYTEEQFLKITNNEKKI